MFFELLKTAEQTATEQREVITYKADGNNVKICKKLLINLAKLYNDDSIVGLYAEPIRFRRYSDEIDNVAIYRCFTPCIKISTIYNEPAEEKADLERAKKRAEEERRQKQAEKEVRERRHAEKVDFLMGYTAGKSKIQTEQMERVIPSLKQSMILEII